MENHKISWRNAGEIPEILQLIIIMEKNEKWLFLFTSTVCHHINANVILTKSNLSFNCESETRVNRGIHFFLLFFCSNIDCGYLF